MTPRDFRVKVEAKLYEREQYWGFLDNLNGKLCSVLVTNITKVGTKPADFMITRRETENKIEETPMSAVERINEQFKTWAVMTRGK